MKKTMTMLMLVAVVGLMAGPASAAIYETGFESGEGTGYFTAGNINGQDSWVVLSGAATVTTDAAHRTAGEQGLHLGPGGDYHSKAYRDFTAHTKLTCTVSVNALGGAGGNSAFVLLGTASFNLGAKVQVGTSAILAWDETAGAYVDLGISGYSNTTWYGVKMVVDTTDTSTSNPHGTYDVYIDSGSGFVSEATGYGLDKAMGTGVTHFYAYISSGVYDAAYDGLSIVPEPATMTLLLLGLPFALRRRR